MLALGKLREEDCSKSEASLGCRVRLCLKRIKVGASERVSQIKVLADKPDDISPSSLLW